jgi:amino acid transporter
MMRMSLVDFILGRPLATGEEPHQRVGAIRGIPIFGLDAISSAAYGPEAALTVLMPLAVAGLTYILPITGAVVAVLTIVYISYRQTIAAYPSGGGSYTVARKNLGARAGLFAAAALMIDYILNVAVGISTGIGALISAVPRLQPYTLSMCLTVLFLLCMINLRGVRETSSVFLIPTLFFVACLSTVIGIGVLRTIWPGQPELLTGHQPVFIVQQTAGTWLILKAFSSGCTALTGVEAVSNGVRAFREPVVITAQRCLTSIVGILIMLLLGVGYLTRSFEIVAKPPGQPGYESILSQLTRAVVGSGIFYDITIASILIVLTCSANTSFADFPRVCRALAADGYLPESFANRGRRLVYSEGIIVLTIMSAVLLWTFGGITDRLIPLFAVGAFTAFTLSQAGMVMHWRRTGGRHAKTKLAINAVGAVATGTTTVIIAVAKFIEGAWLSILLFLCLIRIMTAVRNHYRRLETELAARGALTGCDDPQPIVVVPVETWNKVTRKALSFALSLSSQVEVVHVITDEDEQEDETRELVKTWRTELKESAKRVGCPMPSLVTISSPYRFVIQPIVDHVLSLERKHKERMIAVVIPHLVEPRWYYYFLHNQRGQLLSALLLLKGDRRIVTVDVPWYLKEDSEK